MLNTQPNFPDADGFYESLIAAHQDLSTAQSHAFNARLVLLLANHIGDNAVLQDALNAARVADTADASATSLKA
jgi:hypothetical protein